MSVYFHFTGAPIERGAGLFAAFLALAEATGGAPGRRGREAPTPQGRGPLALAPAVVLRAMGPQNAAAPAWPGQPFYALGQPPYGRRRRTGTGEAGPVGWAPGGGGVLRAQGARKTKAWAGAKGPRPCFVRAVRARRPPGPLGSSTGQTIHPPTLSASASYKQNEPAAPDERRASIIRCKPRKVFQPVFPRFFQKRARGCGGRVAPPHGGATERKPS